ncbi:hypothetical protein [Caldicellulosiruptor acetigenus]|uniref:hypothetical protein n=1 Tax=Caldicellulosiruptor acetigenus TaxID=301953 RepID=UPI000492A30C|nr:hypothetical protein [Caldicellulosiruptor acetigenus]WAM36923.1 hypothetical protein OTK01_000726 [Caldicellulosiruptor acetigenus]
MKSKLNQYKSRILLAIFCIAVLVVLFFNVKLLYIFQEGNPIPLGLAIFRLEYGHLEVVTFAKNKLVQKEGKETLLTSYLKKFGWEFSDRLGSVILYKKGNETLIVKARYFTRRYIVYELNKNLDELD